MRGNLIRKLLVFMIILAPVVSYTGCKKQAKCGCGKDVLRTMTTARANVYWSDQSGSITFVLSGDPYSQYNFCNPTEMRPKLVDYKTGDELMVSGLVYWNCAYLNQAGNSQYQSLYKIYDVEVTDVYMDLYGK
jgi:hypothetical protein